MVTLTNEEFDQIRDALRLAVIQCEEYPSDSSPLRKVREAFKLVAEGSEGRPDRVGELEQTLRIVLAAIYDKQDGSVLRPPMMVVEQVRLVLN